MTVLILVVFNLSIYKMENLKESGTTVYFELMPADPRSLLQGDYMAFRYAIEKDFKPNKNVNAIVIATDQNSVARFLHYYSWGMMLSKNEMLFKLSNLGHIMPDSYFFQEGLAPKYAQAKYGVFKVDPNGDHILIGLADAQLKLIDKMR